MKTPQLTQITQLIVGDHIWTDKKWIFCLILISTGFSMVSAEWRAYNDCAYEKGIQFQKKNVTNYGLGRGNPFPEEGQLLQFKAGKETGVTASFVERKSQGNPINWANDESMFDNGSDADKIFKDVVDASGNMSYNDGPGWYLDLIFSGLKPGGVYTFVGTVNRNGGPDYKDRVTNWKIMGAESFTYTSSATAQKVSEDSVEFSTGQNNKGLIARWENIRSGNDGEFLIRTSHSIGSKKGGIKNAHAYKGYAGGLFMLEYNGTASVELTDKLTTCWATVKFRP